MPWVPPDSTDSYVRLLRAIQRPRLAVHMDADLVTQAGALRRQDHLPDLAEDGVLAGAGDARCALEKVQRNLANGAGFDGLERCAGYPLVECAHRGAAPDLVIHLAAFFTGI